MKAANMAIRLRRRSRPRRRTLAAELIHAITASAPISSGHRAVGQAKRLTCASRTVGASDLNLDQFAGGIYPAFKVGRLPAPDQRPAFAEQVRRASDGTW